MAKVGVGVITVGERELKPYRVDQSKHIFYPFVDEGRKGVAYARNQCLKYLYDQGCDYIIVFDNDCYPLHDGYIDYFTSQMEKSGLHFFTLPESFKDRLVSVEGEIGYWDGTLCQFAMHSRELIETVGYYNEAYDRYGFEDSAYICRVVKSGLNGEKEGIPSPIRTLAYIHSEDVYGENPKSSLTLEEKQNYIQKNLPIYREEITSEKIYYPYQGD